MVVYFELLDISEVSFPNFLPRISLWTNDNISIAINADRLIEDSNLFGRASMKDMSNIALTKNQNKRIFIDTFSYLEVILKSILSGQVFSNVREQLQSSYHILWNDLISATRPVLLSQIIKSVASIKEITDNTVFTSPNLLQNDSTADKQLLVTNISPPSKSGIVTLSKVYKDPEIGDTLQNCWYK